MNRAGADAPSFAVVVPTIGRPCLSALVESLGAARGPRPAEIVLVDDRRADVDDRRPGLGRPGPSVEPLPVGPEGSDGTPIRWIRTPGRGGPAAARNAGWRAVSTEWVAFLDDDVVVGDDWLDALACDLTSLPAGAAASQGRIRVHLPRDRRPTDWERNVAGLENACWATADMAYRRSVLEEVGGFDERFPRAYREDSDLALRTENAGWLVLRGAREVAHRVRPADRWVSVRLQAGNADDMRMRVLHGRDWRTRVHAGPGRSARHAGVTASLLMGVAGALSGRRGVAAVGALGWLAGTCEFAWARIAPGPRSVDEVATMVATSVLIPPAAVYHLAKGRATVRAGGRGRAGRRSTRAALRPPTVWSRLRYGPVPKPVTADPYWTPKAVLFDRDGTLIVDRHYLSDPAGVTPMPGARCAVERVRNAGLATAVVTNQSGVGRGLMTRQQMESVNAQVERVIGPFDWWAVCCHHPDDGCTCRKPRAGLVLEAADRLGVSPSDCAVIGDIGADVEAAEAAGARAVLVPTPRTRSAEVRSAPQVAPDLLTALDLVMAGRC